MDRKKFLSSLGTSAACICAVGIGGCVKASVPPPGSSSSFSLDLSNQLKNVGDYLVNGPFAIVRTAPGNTEASFSVLNTTCPHQGYSVQYFPDPNDPTKGQFTCPGHGSTFTQNGSKIQGLTPSDLPKISFTITSTSLVIST